MIRTQMMLSPEQHAGLQNLAAERHVSMAALIREAVDHLLSLSVKSSIEVALEVAGKYSSDVPSLAQRHDEYLGEDGRW